MGTFTTLDFSWRRREPAHRAPQGHILIFGPAAPALRPGSAAWRVPTAVARQSFPAITWARKNTTARDKQANHSPGSAEQPGAANHDKRLPRGLALARAWLALLGCTARDQPRPALPADNLPTKGLRGGAKTTRAEGCEGRNRCRSSAQQCAAGRDRPRQYPAPERLSRTAAAGRPSRAGYRPPPRDP